MSCPSTHFTSSRRPISSFYFEQCWITSRLPHQAYNLFEFRIHSSWSQIQVLYELFNTLGGQDRLWLGSSKPGSRPAARPRLGRSTSPPLPPLHHSVLMAHVIRQITYFFVESQIQSDHQDRRCQWWDHEEVLGKFLGKRIQIIPSPSCPSPFRTRFFFGQCYI